MRTRSEIEQDMRKVFGRAGFVSEKQIKEYTNMGRDRLKTLLVRTPHFGEGHGKRYAIIDIAEKLAADMRS